MRAKNHKTYIFLRKMHFFSEQTYRKIKKLENDKRKIKEKFLLQSHVAALAGVLAGDFSL